jgi:isohexenylglutaconyl-CoA hydratase
MATPVLPDVRDLKLGFQNGWLEIELNRPGARNALSSELIDELKNVLRAADQERRIRGIQLRGAGGVFCAGGDIQGFAVTQASGDSSQQAIALANRAGGELFHVLSRMRVPVLALIEGAAIAGGLGLACAADIVVTAENAKFSLTETRLGIAPAQIACYVVARVGLAQARRLMLTGARFDGREAARLGIADYVARDRAELEQLAAQLRADIDQGGPEAIAVTKEILLATVSLTPESMLDFAAERFAHLLSGPEAREGISAFLEKRPARWQRRE